MTFVSHSPSLMFAVVNCCNYKSKSETVLKISADEGIGSLVMKCLFHLSVFTWNHLLLLFLEIL